jgi:signal transduction histidine kinase
VTETSRRWSIGAAATGVIVVGLAAEWLAHGVQLDFAAQRDLVTGWAVAASGLVAWAAVPRSRIGLLLVLSGLTWFVWNLGSQSDVGWLADALTNLCAGFLAHAIFTWPSGQAQRPIERALVVAGYVVALFPPLWARDASLLVVAALLVTGLVADHVSLPPRARRVRRPALLLGLGLAAVLATKGTLAGLLRGAGVAYPSLSVDLWQIAVVAVAIGLTWSLVALERRRTRATDIVVRLGEVRPTLRGADLAEEVGLADDAAVDEALVAAHAMAARNMTLQEELRAQVQSLERSRRRLVEAGDDERAALEEELRRGPVARLGRIERMLRDRRAATPSTLTDAGARLDRALGQLRLAQVELAELASGLDPSILRERGLGAALRDAAERSPVPVDALIEPSPRTAPSVARTLFFVASEALVNVARHASAGHAWLRLEVDRDSLRLTVEDDGVGVAGAPMGSGLRGLRDRLDALGGSLSIGARAEGGTTLLAIVPAAGVPHAARDA